MAGLKQPQQVDAGSSTAEQAVGGGPSRPSDAPWDPPVQHKAEALLAQAGRQGDRRGAQRQRLIGRVDIKS